MKNRIISLLIMVSMGIALVPAANVSSAGKPAAATSWFEFNKATGGWIVKDLSRGADSGGGAFEDYGHRVQIIPYNTEPDDMPNPNGYEVLLRLPEFKADGEKWSFQDIAKVSVRFDIDWEKWADPNDRLDFQIITHSNTDDFKQHKDGGRIDEILEEAGVIREVTPLSEYPTPIVMTATPTMYKKGPYPLAIEYWAEYFKVMVTNWTSGAGFPTSPVTATVHLLDHDNNVIRLVCPDCNKEECVGSN
ncbi:MAG: hypothetical protein FWG33_04715, partial [Oscillospiraceae bacterium]|nr:hypothetical protein [Oscillospiraceae bacterium]